MLKTTGRHQLHANTNAVERLSTLDLLSDRVPHAGKGSEPVSAIAESPNSWKHDAIRLAHDFGIGCDEDCFALSLLAAGALEGLGGRVQIA